MTKLKQAETELTEHDIYQDSVNEDNNEAIEVFETRWRYAVFPAMIAFIILASFGFYLIYGMLQHMQSMSKDIHRMTSLMEVTVPIISHDISELNKTISSSMPRIQSSVSDMTKSTQSMNTSITGLNETISTSMPSIQSNVSDMSKSTQSMATDISKLNKTISVSMPSIQSNVSDMTKSTQSMATSTRHLDRSTYELNRSISRPMDFMNNMIPFNVDPPPRLRYRQ